MFPVRHRDARLPNKQVVFGIVVDGKAKAYPLAHLVDREWFDLVGSVEISVTLTETGPRAVREDNGREILGTVAYWFAWAAFHPKTKIHHP